MEVLAKLIKYIYFSLICQSAPRSSAYVNVFDRPANVPCAAVSIHAIFDLPNDRPICKRTFSLTFRGKETRGPERIEGPYSHLIMAQKENRASSQVLTCYHGRHRAYSIDP